MRFLHCLTLALASVVTADAARNRTFTVEAEVNLFCKLPPNAARSWRLRPQDDASYGCLAHSTKHGAYWAMLNAYRSGGTQGKHWKYVKSENARECLTNWTYYGKDGDWIVEHVQGRTTRTGDKGKRLWCALPTGQVKKKTETEPAGVEGKQWAFCSCSENPQSV